MDKTMKDLVAAAQGNVAQVAPADALAAQQSDALILDVREPAELQSDGAVADALHIPRGVLESKADPSTGSGDQVLTERHGGNSRVLVLCASGARATLAADTLRTMGYDAAVITGGMKAWKAANLPTKG